MNKIFLVLLVIVGVLFLSTQVNLENIPLIGDFLDNLGDGLKDEIPILRQEVVSTTPVVAGCSPSVFPARVDYQATVSASKPSYLSVFDLRYPIVDSYDLNSQGLFDWFSTGGFCYAYLMDNADVSQGKFKMVDSGRIQVSDRWCNPLVTDCGGFSWTGHLVYRLPDNNCDGRFDDHSMMLCVACWDHDDPDKGEYFDTGDSEHTMCVDFGSVNGVTY